jgi:hypothetical protein
VSIALRESESGETREFEEDCADERLIERFFMFLSDLGFLCARS